MLHVFFLALSFILGTIIGSFLNVCIHRLPAGESIVHPPSHCPHCKSHIPWHDNIPLLSYLLLRGHCRFCHSTISLRYPAVELLAGLLSLALFRHVGLGLFYFSHLAFISALLVVTFIDLDHQIIPDVISLPGAAIGFLLSFLGVGWQSSFLGFWIGGGILLLVASAYRAVTGREGMGGGDVKLMAMIGAFLGWQAIPLTLFFASFTGSVVGVTAMLRQGVDSKHPLPFGPFLSFGAVLYIFFGKRLISWYLGFM